ncbi:hypothetical protein F4778DRAFT_781623 [Xylariomycetidae sp. FL2044]|nr:hypothetical protein F4778DRAFT_781623 [Xylariomycetidae sp. FL2044]
MLQRSSLAAWCLALVRDLTACQLIREHFETHGPWQQIVYDSNEPASRAVHTSPVEGNDIKHCNEVESTAAGDDDQTDTDCSLLTSHISWRGERPNIREAVQELEADIKWLADLSDHYLKGGPLSREIPDVMRRLKTAREVVCFHEAVCCYADSLAKEAARLGNWDRSFDSPTPTHTRCRESRVIPPSALSTRSCSTCSADTRCVSVNGTSGVGEVHRGQTYDEAHLRLNVRLSQPTFRPSGWLKTLAPWPCPASFTALKIMMSARPEYLVNKPPPAYASHGTNSKSKDITTKQLELYDVIAMSYNSLESMYRRQKKGFKRQDDLYKSKSAIHQVKFLRIILDEARWMLDAEGDSDGDCARPIWAMQRWVAMTNQKTKKSEKKTGGSES